MSFGSITIPGVDLTPRSVRVLRNSDNPVPVRPPDPHQTYTEHIEDQLLAAEARLREASERDARLVALVGRLASRAGLAVPPWVGGEVAPRPKPKPKRSGANAVRHFSAELLASVETGPIAFGGLSSTPPYGHVRLDGRKLPTSPIERVMLRLLLARAPEPVVHAEFARAIWGLKDPDDPCMHRVRVNMTRLRRRLESAGWSGRIARDPCVGYCLEAP